MAECFTCAHKLSRELTKEERAGLQRQHVAKTGRKTLLIPEMEYKCNLTGKIIKQTDPACDRYEPEPTMVEIRFALSESARKARMELKNKED